MYLFLENIACFVSVFKFFVLPTRQKTAGFLGVLVESMTDCFESHEKSILSISLFLTVASKSVQENVQQRTFSIF